MLYYKNSNMDTNFFIINKKLKKINLLLNRWKI